MQVQILNQEEFCVAPGAGGGYTWNFPARGDRREVLHVGSWEDSCGSWDDSCGSWEDFCGSREHSCGSWDDDDAAPGTRRAAPAPMQGDAG